MNILWKDRDPGCHFQNAVLHDIRSYAASPFIFTLGAAPITKVDINSIIDMGLRIVRFRMSPSLTESDKMKLVCLLNSALTRCCEKYNVSTWPMALCADVPNACIRTGYLEIKKEYPDGITLKEGSIVEVTCDVQYLKKCTANRIFIDDPYIVPYLVPGTEITINFGSAVMISIKKIDDQNVKCKVICEGMMNDQSFVCVRGITHTKPALSETDIELIEFAKVFKFDIIIINSVRIAETVRRVRKMTTSYKPLLMSAICEQEGLDNIDSIIEASDGIVLAREFLVNEVHDKYKMITIQLYVSAKCRLKGKPLYLSGQILKSTLIMGKPTISDINDITNAVLQRSGFILRTFKDPSNLVKALRFLDDICGVVEPLTRYDDDLMRISMEYKQPVNAAKAAVLAAVFLAKMTKSLVIIVPTVTGRTVKQVVHMAADNLVIAITSSPTVAKQLQLFKGAVPIIYEKKSLANWQDEMNARLKFAVEYGQKLNVLSHGSPYVLLRKSYPTTSYCDLVSACAAVPEEDIIRLEYNTKRARAKLHTEISQLNDLNDL